MKRNSEGLRAGLLSALVLAGALGMSPAASAAENCLLHRHASLPLTTGAQGLVSVPVDFAGRALSFMVDTGGAYSTVSTAIAAERHLSPTPASLPMRMLNGMTAQQVWPDNFSLDRIRSESQRFFLQPDVMNGLDGMIGANILRNYDADFDFAGRKLNLFAQDHCPGKVVYWTKGPLTVLPADIDRVAGQVRVTVRLDGKEIPALIDTGSSITLMGMATAGRFLDLNADSPGLVPDSSSVNGMGGRNWRRRFQQLELGDTAIDSPSILILDDAQMREMGTELILGMDLLRKLHLYIAYGEEKLYLTPADAN